MRYLKLLTCLLCFATVQSFAQEPLVVAAETVPASLPESGSGVAQFNFGNLSGGDILVTSPLEITVSFGRVEPTGPPTGSGAGFFSWVYDAGTNTYTGDLITDVLEGEGGNIVFAVDVTGTEGQNAGLNVNLQGTNAFPGNVVDNDNTNYFAEIGAAVLPVDWVSFTNKKEECGVNVLKWATSLEVNNRGFEVQKQVGEKGEFKTIGFVNATSKSKSLNNYSFVDRFSEDDYGKTAYYRLQQIDLDGTSDFSSVVQVETEDCRSFEVAIFPNPTLNVANVTVKGWETDDAISYTILTTSGELVEEGELTYGRNARLNFENFNSGIYNVLFNYNGKTVNKQVIKVK